MIFDIKRSVIYSKYVHEPKQQLRRRIARTQWVERRRVAPEEDRPPKAPRSWNFEDEIGRKSRNRKGNAKKKKAILSSRERERD